MANEIKAKISADASGFDAGLRRATGALEGASRRWERSFAGLNRGVAAFAGLVGGGLALGAIDNFAKSALAMGGAIDDASKTAGIGAKALQEYRFAAKQSGIEIEQTDKAIATFTRNLGEARRGNREFADTFERIGVAAGDSAETALRKAFEFLAQIADKAQRAAVASELFGARAQRMILLVDGGIGTLDQFRQQANDLGIVLGDDLVAGADAAGDRIDALETIMKQRLNKTVLENIDGFVRFKTLLNDAAAASIELAAGIGNLTAAFRRQIATANRDAIDDALPVEELIKRRNKLADDLATNSRLIAKNAADIPDNAFPGFIAQAKRNIAELESDSALLERRIGEIDAAIARQNVQLVGPGKAGGDAAGAGVGAGGGVTLAPLANPFPGLDAPTLKTEALKKSAAEAAAKIAAIGEQTRTPLEALSARLEEIQGLMRFAENAEEAALLERASAAIEQQMRGLEVQTKLWGVALEDVTRGLADSFANAILNGEKLGRTLKNLIRQLATRALSNFLFAKIGGALGLPAIPGLASGGPVSAGRTFLVGEQGPEIFTPRVSGAIIPNDALAGGGVTVVQNLRFDVGLESVDSRISALTPSISASVVEAVQRAQSRPRYA